MSISPFRVKPLRRHQRLTNDRQNHPQPPHPLISYRPADTITGVYDNGWWAVQLIAINRVAGSGSLARLTERQARRPSPTRFASIPPLGPRPDNRSFVFRPAQHEWTIVKAADTFREALFVLADPGRSVDTRCPETHSQTSAVTQQAY